MEYARATNIAASLGQGMAYLFGFVGLFFNPFLIVIALFVWIGAAQEASAVQVKSATAGVPVTAAMITKFEALRAEDTLEDAVRAILRGSQSDFPVTSRGDLVGVLTKSDLVEALAKHDRSQAVSTVMRTDFPSARVSESLDVAAQRLAECACRTMPVVRDGDLVGLLTTENLGEYLLFKSATSSSGTSPRMMSQYSGDAPFLQRR
jgi:predicted transcriptional regulator